MVYEVEFETTLPPWRIGYEKIEADDTTDLKRKFASKHEAAHLIRVRCENNKS